MNLQILQQVVKMDDPILIFFNQSSGQTLPSYRSSVCSNGVYTGLSTLFAETLCVSSLLCLTWSDAVWLSP